MWLLYRPQLILVSFALSLPVVTSTFLPSTKTSFNFRYDPPDVVPPFLVTEQCQNLNFTVWRQDDTPGPFPVPPYFLHVYTSTFIVPFIVPVGSEPNFVWHVPFVPGTLFQICMFDSVGNSGSCRDVYSIIPARGATPPSCPNVTFPAGPMDVVAEVVDGRMSQYGWIPQCSDIALTPRNGTPPYTFRILPSHHPLYTITSTTRATVNWTISLGRSLSFFVAVYDSVGNSWTNGPLHVGKGKRITAECFGISSATKPFPLAGIIGTTISGLVLGVLVAYLFTLFHSKAKRKKEKMELIVIEDPHSPPDDGHQWHAVPNIELDQSDHLLRRYQVEPFAFPDEKSRTTGDHTSSPPSTNTASYAESSSMAQPCPRAPVTPRHVFVVHHDAGRVPETVYTPSGVVDEEVPPDYPGGLRSAAATTADPGPVNLLS